MADRVADPIGDDTEVLQEIARIVRDELGVTRELKPSDDLLTDVQLDSVGILTLVVGLEDRFRVALEEDDAGKVRTVQELAALVMSRRC